MLVFMMTHLFGAATDVLVRLAELGGPASRRQLASVPQGCRRMQHTKRTARLFQHAAHPSRLHARPGTVIFAKQRHWPAVQIPLRGVVVIHDANPVQLLSRAWMHHPRQHGGGNTRVSFSPASVTYVVAATARAKSPRPLEATPSAARSSAAVPAPGQRPNKPYPIVRAARSQTVTVATDACSKKRKRHSRSVTPSRPTLEHRTAWPWTFPGLFQQFQSRCTWASAVNSAKAAEISCVTSRSRYAFPRKRRAATASDQAPLVGSLRPGPCSDRRLGQGWRRAVNQAQLGIQRKDAPIRRVTMPVTVGVSPQFNGSKQRGPRALRVFWFCRR